MSVIKITCTWQKQCRCLPSPMKDPQEKERRPAPRPFKRTTKPTGKQMTWPRYQSNARLNSHLTSLQFLNKLKIPGPDRDVFHPLLSKSSFKSPLVRGMILFSDPFLQFQIHLCLTAFLRTGSGSFCPFFLTCMPCRTRQD